MNYYDIEIYEYLKKLNNDFTFLTFDNLKNNQDTTIFKDIEDILSNTDKTIYRDDLEKDIYRVGKSMKRIQKFCPHKGVNLEKCGIIENGHITCPLHNWKFDLQSGRCLTSDKYKLTIQEME